MDKLPIALCILLPLASFVHGMVHYSQLPEKVAIHFNAWGEADSFGSKFFLMTIYLGANIFTHMVSLYVIWHSSKHAKVSKVINLPKLIMFISVPSSILFIGLFEMVFSANETMEIPKLEAIKMWSIIIVCILAIIAALLKESYYLKREPKASTNNSPTTKITPIN